MKKKSKLKITIISLSIFLVVVLGVGAVGFYVAGDYIFTTLLESYIEDEMISSLGLEDGIIESIQTEVPDEAKAENTDSTTAPETTKDTEAAQGDKVAQDQPSTVNKPQTMTQAEVKKAVQEKAKVINDAIPAKDKMDMSSLILSNLSQQDISYLAGLAADGLSGADLAEAKRIARERFTEEQLQEVYGYYKEYQNLMIEK